MASLAGPPHDRDAKPLNTATHQTLRFTFSPQEYRALHAYLSKKRATRPIVGKVPSPSQYEQAAARAKQHRAAGKKADTKSSAAGDKDGKIIEEDDFNAAAVRAAVRVFLVSKAGLKAYDLLLSILLRRPAEKPPARRVFSPNTRLAFSLASLVYTHRILHRFCTRLRAQLIHPDAAPFRRRNPRIAAALTSRLAPAIGASLAGVTMGAYPADQFRLTVAIYAASRAAEFLYNSLEDDGLFDGMPWLSSALLMPPVMGQLLHAFLFDRDCFPAPFGNFILRFSNVYVQPRPEHLPKEVAWPDVYQIVDGLAELCRLKHPPFVSPILFPETQNTLPPSLAPVNPIIAAAHPAITSMSCALLHPTDPSCIRTFVQYWLNAFPRLVRVFAVIFSALSLLRLKALRAAPISFLNGLAKRILKTSTFVTGSIGMGWATICAFQSLLPRTFIPTQRFFWGGFAGGMWAWLIRNDGRGQFLYCLRNSMDSTWKVGKKHGWWKPVRNGDLLVVCASLACISAVFDRNPDALRSKGLARCMYFLRGADPPKSEEQKSNTSG